MTRRALSGALLLLLLIAPTMRAYSSELCIDGFGRPGRYKLTSCPSHGLCPAVASYWCDATPQPPLRVADGEWRCDDDRYELAGAKFSWPGGRAHIEPAECAPRAAQS